MPLTRREIALAGSAALILPTLATTALAEGDDAGVAAAVEALRQAIVKADKAKLAELAHDKLAYCHSSGKLETKDQYIEAYTNVGLSSDRIFIKLPEFEVELMSHLDAGEATGFLAYPGPLADVAADL